MIDNSGYNSKHGTFRPSLVHPPSVHSLSERVRLVPQSGVSDSFVEAKLAGEYDL